MNKFSLQFLFLIAITHNFCSTNLLTATGTPIMVNRSSKSMLPADLLAEAKASKLSILAPLPTDLPVLYQNYPDGSTIFPNNSSLATKFNIMIAAIKKNPKVIEFFRKIHILSLNQLYEYIMKIYTNFNITNPGCDQTQENPKANVAEYLTDQATYATNKKKLLMNHFLNIIHAQFGASIVSYAPATQPDMAVAFGTIFVQNDHGIDLTTFITTQTDPAIAANNQDMLKFLKLYTDFFQDYTSYLAKIDSNGVNQYYTIAQSIQKGINQSTTPLNPAMFFYDTESMRSIQFIPFVAGTIPTNSQLIPWAPSIVNAAVKNLQSNGQSIAYFKDAAGNKTSKQQDAKSLFLVTVTGPNLFEEELLAQPAWMNTQDGSIRILQGCLGNFSALTGLGILDATLETIIQIANSPDSAPMHRSQTTSSSLTNKTNPASTSNSKKK